MSKNRIRALTPLCVFFNLIFTPFIVGCSCNNKIGNESTYLGKTNLDYSYGEHSLQKFDLYFQDDYKTQKNFDLVLFIHGGAWNSGDKAELTEKCKTILNANKGIMCVNMNYRLVNNEDDTCLEDMVEDITHALNKIKDIVLKMNATVNNCALVGYSAGAHLATYYSFAKNNSSPIPLKFCVNFVGPVDLTDNNFNPAFDDPYIVDIIKKLTCSTTIEQAKTKLSSISPITYINEKTVPTINAYGKVDTIVPYSNAEKLYNKLTEYKIANTFVVFDNSGHGLDNKKDEANWTTLYSTVQSYIQTYFN